MKQGWENKKLGELVNVKTGKLDANAASEDGEYPFFTCSKETLRISNYSYDCECVLVAGNGDLNVKYYKGKFDAYQRTYIITLKDNVSQTFVPYIYKFFNSYIEELRNKSIGGIIKYIKLGDITNALIPLPPLSLQHSIVSELDEINNLLSLKRKELETYDKLAQSLFYEMFGDPVENEKGWEVKKLGEVCEVSSFKRVLVQDVLENGPVPFIRGTELTAICKDNKREYKMYITMEHYEKVKAISGVPKLGDLLVPSINSEGYVWVVDTEEPMYYKDGRVLWVHVDTNSISSIALQRIMTILLKDNYSKITNGAVFAELNLSILRDFPVILPPLPLQQLFATRIEAIEAQKANVKAAIEKLEALLAARMQYWFE